MMMGFPCGLAGKESAFNVGNLGLIPGLGRSPGEGKGCPLQYSGLENSMDCIVHGVAKSRTRLSDFHFYFTMMMRSQFNSVAQSCPTFCNPMNCSTPGLQTLPLSESRSVVSDSLRAHRLYSPRMATSWI